MESTIRRDLDRYAAILGLLTALALLPVQLVINHVYAQTIPVVLGLACVLYLLALGTTTSEDTVTLPRWATHALPGAVLFGSAWIVLFAHSQGARTGLFYGVAGLLATLVLAQVLFADRGDLHAGVLLTQVLVLGGAIRIAAYVTTAAYVGIDIWTHVPHFVRGILQTGTIEGMGTTKYVMAPFYHLVVATTRMFTGLPMEAALVASIGVVMPLAVLFVFLAADLLVPRRWALFATALFAFSDSAIRWSIHLIPTSLGLVFFVAILALVVRLVQLRTTGRETLIAVLLFVAIAFTHQVSSFILLAFMGSGWLAQQLIRLGLFDSAPGGTPELGGGDLQAVSFSGFFVFITGLLTLIWSLTPYYGRPFLQTVLLFLQDALFGESDFSGGITGGGGGGIPLVAWVIQHFHLIGFLLFLFGTTVGSLYAFRRGRRNQAIITLVVASVVMTAFTLLPPLVGVGTFLPGRWYVFLYAVMAILTAVGMEYFRRGLSPVPFVLVLLVFLYAFPTIMIASPNATLDAPLLDTRHPRLSYTQEEVAAMETIGRITSGRTQPIDTDFPYALALNRYVTGRGEDRFDIATIPRGGTAQGETVIYRRYQTTGAPQFDDANGTQRTYRVRPSALCGPDRHRLYANGDVRMCRAAG